MSAASVSPPQPPPPPPRAVPPPPGPPAPPQPPAPPAQPPAPPAPPASSAAAAQAPTPTGRSGGRGTTNRSSLNSKAVDSRLRSMVATPGNLHKYLARNNSKDFDKQSTTDELYSPITRNPSFRLANGVAGDVSTSLTPTTVSDDDDASVEQEWGLNRQRANTN